MLPKGIGRARQAADRLILRASRAICAARVHGLTRMAHGCVRESTQTTRRAVRAMVWGHQNARVPW